MSMRIPGIHRCPSGILWMWHRDGKAPSLYRWDPLRAAWEGLVSHLGPGSELRGDWELCEGCPKTGQPRNMQCLRLLNQSNWDNYPDWFIEMYCGLGSGVSER